MQIAKRVYSLAQKQNDPALMLGGHRALAGTLFYLGDFESARQHAIRAVQIWRSGNVQFHSGRALYASRHLSGYLAQSEWHLGEIASCQPTIAEAISLAKKLNDTNALAMALSWAAGTRHNERNPAEADRLASDLIELSMRHNFVYWLAVGDVYRGWARSVSGDSAEGIPWIERGIRDYRATGAVLDLPCFLGLKAEALHLANRTSEALEAIDEAETLVERFEQRYWCAELHRLRGVILANLGAEEIEIKASFCAAISTARKQKSISLAKRAEESYAEYRRQKTNASGGREFRLPLW